MSQPSEQARNRQELRKAFVAGAKWWNCHTSEFPVWPNSTQEFAETEAERRYGKPEEKESGSWGGPHWSVIYDKEPE